jgi:asparagine synthase (glutamine-hydrolysing)
MCGIAGCALSSDALAESGLDGTRRMIQRMRLRGPDAERLWTGDGIVLGHRRLAILDLAARANQPMLSDDGRYAIVFNGEIYNFRELRHSLDRRGVRFHTTSDTEVLLALFAQEGERMLHRLRGMFAFAIWDALSRQLFLARDPYGIKPLYYARIKNGFLFASQVKGLLASDLIPRLWEPAGLAGFYLWGNMPEPWTLYRDVFALPAGHWLRVRGGVPEVPTCWYDIRAHWQGEGEISTGEELGERVREALVDSVRAHLVSDVPISVFLSGGVDSAVVAALACQLGASVEGITVGFEEFTGRAEDELPAAAATAAHYGLRHFKRRVSRAEFARQASRIMTAMDQPSIDGINTWFASKAAAERGYKVVLSGIGGDELFCGYSSFVRIARMTALGRAATATSVGRALLSAPCAYLGKRFMHPKVAGLPSLARSLEGVYFLSRGLFLPHELPGLMGHELASEGLARLGGSPAGITPVPARDRIAAIGLLESTWYLRNQLLRDSDWASMDHSLELRTPIVDVPLLSALAPFVSAFAGVGKRLMSRSPGQALPVSVTSRRKTGFSVPMANWLPAVVDHLPEACLMRSPRRSCWAREWATILLSQLTADGSG